MRGCWLSLFDSGFHCSVSSWKAGFDSDLFSPLFSGIREALITQDDAVWNSDTEQKGRGNIFLFLF